MSKPKEYPESVQEKLRQLAKIVADDEEDAQKICDALNLVETVGEKNLTLEQREKIKVLEQEITGAIFWAN